MLSATITIEGNIANEPQLRYTGKGLACCEFRVMVNERIKKDGEWIDGEPTVYSVLTWRRLAEHVGQSLSKGDRVIVCGRPFTDKWNDQGGEIHTMLKLNADAVGLSLTFTPAKPVKATRTADAASSDEWTVGPTEEPPF